MLDERRWSRIKLHRGHLRIRNNFNDIDVVQFLNLPLQRFDRSRSDQLEHDLVKPAFLAARMDGGDAETVLASHWKVSDKATSQLMTDFLRRWRGGAPRAQAWREAQLALLRSKEFANPYYWAAFTLTGQWH